MGVVTCWVHPSACVPETEPSRKGGADEEDQQISCKFEWPVIIHRPEGRPEI